MSPDTDQQERYRLLTLLARGGMADIYLARQVGLAGFERLVVIKKIHPDLATQTDYLEMFLDEARIAARLNHPNIVQIHDFGLLGQEYYIAMEYLEGESLYYLAQTSLLRGVAIPPELAAAIVAQVCNALEHAHTMTDLDGASLNIVHRDVTPQNIIILYSGVVKLLDFGIAKAEIRTHQTRPGFTKGKLAYMAPEQVMGEAVDARTDLFALGVVFWELLARQRLIGEDGQVNLNELLSGPVKKVRWFAPKVPAAFAAIAERAIEKNPAARFQSAREMEAAVQEAFRRTSTAAGASDLVKFITRTMADRIRQKKDVLRQIVRNPDEALTTILKPGTEQILISPRELDAEGKPEAETAPEQPSRTATLAAPPPASYPGDPPESPAAGSSSTDALRRAFERPPAPREPKQKTETLMVPAEGKRAPGVLRELETRAPWVRNHATALVAAGVVILIAWLVLVLRGSPDEAELPEKPETLGSAEPRRTAPAPAEPAPAAPEPAVAPVAEQEPEPREALPTVPRGLQKFPLSIYTQPPGCAVTVNDSKLEGVSPFERVDAPANLELKVAAACEGFKLETQQIQGLPGQKRVLMFILERSRRPLPKEPAPLARVETGLLRVDTDPYTEVYLDQRKLGTTPLTGVSLPEGKHRLLFVNPALAIRKNRWATIRKGETTTLWFEFNR